MLKASDIQNFIPWRAVSNGNSVSAQCRIIFNASQQTHSGTSLNDILAKGNNNMNRLVKVVIRWPKHRTRFHTNMKKICNLVQFVREDWCLQRYIWQKDLEKSKILEKMIIKTLINSNQVATKWQPRRKWQLSRKRVERHTTELPEKEYLLINVIVQNDIYVDDCLPGENTGELTLEGDELVLNRTKEILRTTCLLMIAVLM